MRVDVFTIFPGFFDGPLSASLLGRARERGLLDVRLHDPRDSTTDRHRAVDDTPFGGGAGMVMMPEPLFAAVEANPASDLLVLESGHLVPMVFVVEATDGRVVVDPPAGLLD